MPVIPVVNNFLVAKDPIPLMKCVKMDEQIKEACTVSSNTLCMCVHAIIQVVVM